MSNQKKRGLSAREVVEANREKLLEWERFDPFNQTWIWGRDCIEPARRAGGMAHAGRVHGAESV